MQKANLLEKENKMPEVFAIRSEPVNQSLTSLFKNKVEETHLENYPQEMEYYLAKNKEKVILIEKELYQLLVQLYLWLLMWSGIKSSA